MKFDADGNWVPEPLWFWDATPERPEAREYRLEFIAAFEEQQQQAFAIVAKVAR